MAERIDIGGRLHSTETGNVVAGANEIYDDTKDKKQNVINQENDAALADRYTKSETYNKTELNNMITTPNQEYVTVAAYASLPASGSADTIYRVSSWDGNANSGQGAVDATKYTEYAWNGSAYVPLSVKTQIGEVFDISQWKASGGVLATYADLSAALGTNGENVPVGVRHGGMEVRFVHNTDNKYVQWRLKSKTFNTYIDNWQGVDDEISLESNNLATSFGVANSTVAKVVTQNAAYDSWKYNMIAGHVYYIYKIRGTVAIYTRYTKDSENLEQITIEGNNILTKFVPTNTTEYLRVLADSATELYISEDKMGIYTVVRNLYDIGVTRLASILGLAIIQDLKQSKTIPYYAQSGDILSISFEGEASCGLRLLDSNGNTIGEKLIPSGGTSVSYTVKINADLYSIKAVYGNINNITIDRVSKNAITEIDNSIEEYNENIKKYFAIKAGESGSIPFSSSNFEIGNINNYGNPVSSEGKTMRTKEFYRIVEQSILSYVTINDYRVAFHFYYTNGEHSATDWLTGTGTIDIPVGCASLKICLSKPTSASSYPSIKFEDTGFTLSASKLPIIDYAASLTEQDNINTALSELGIVLNKRLLRSSFLSFLAQTGDKIHISIEGYSDCGIQFEDSNHTLVGTQILIPEGSDSLVKDIIVKKEVRFVKAVYGNIKINEIKVLPQGNVLRIPIYAPSPQLPAGNEGDADFDAENLTSSQLYAAYDAMIEKLAAPASQNKFTPKYATLNSAQGDDASGQYKLRTYVFTKRNRFAWKHANRLYAWKDANDNILYIDSCSPRVGDTLYSNTSRTNSGKTVSFYDCATQSIVASDNVTYYLYADGDVKPDMYWTTDCLNRTGNTSSTTLAFYDKSGTFIGNATYEDDTHLLYDGKSYERCSAQDYHTDNRATIFIWANEHGPQSDPNECAITLYRLAKDLCIGCRNNDFISFLKNYCKLVFIPVGNPWGMNNWAAHRAEGRNNYNGININRNYNTPGWATVVDSNKGDYAGDQNETQYIMNMCLDFEADIAIDIHCLGYTGINNEGKCHWHAYIPSGTLNDYISNVMLGYGIVYSSYGNAEPETNSTGADWINFKGINGGLIEMNAGNYASSYNGNQHSAFIMEVDYTFLLNIIRMFYYGVDPDIDFSKLGIR